MTATRRKESSFRGRVHASTKTQERSGGKSYLKLPKDVSALVFDEKVLSVQMDFMPYVISDPKHPDIRDVGVEVGDLWYRRPFKVHKNIGADNKSYICLSSIEKRCPICEFQKELFQTDRDAAIKLYPQDRELYTPIPLDSKKHDAEPGFIWDMAKTLFRNALERALDKKPANEIFPDLNEGLTLECDFNWKTIGNSKPFPEVTHVAFFERDEVYDESIVDSVPDLDAIINDSVLSYDELKAAFFEMDKEDDGGELEDGEPKHSKKSVVTSKRKPIETEEEEEEEKPKKPLARNSEKSTVGVTGKRKPVEEEEEEEEKPVRKSVRTTSTKPEAKTIVAEEDEDVDTEEIPRKERCTACQGTGKNSKGRKCPICNGAGRISLDENEDEQKMTPKNKCPYEHIFGKDSEKFDDCDSCKIWDSCADEKEKLGKK
jgi:hypothetical protein